MCIWNWPFLKGCLSPLIRYVIKNEVYKNTSFTFLPFFHKFVLELICGSIQFHSITIIWQILTSKITSTSSYYKYAKRHNTMNLLSIHFQCFSIGRHLYKPKISKITTIKSFIIFCIPYTYMYMCVHYCKLVIFVA